MHKFTLKFFFLLLFIGFSFSCQKKEKELTWALTPSGEKISFPIDDQTPNISEGLQYFKGEKEYLFNVIWNLNSLQIYDFETGLKIKDLRFDNEGPNGVGPIFGFHVHSLDSIFLFNPPFTSTINLVNSDGEIQQRIDYQIPDEGGSAFVHNSYMISPPVIDGNLLAVNHRFGANIRLITGEELSSKAMGYQIDLTTGKTNFFNHFFPSDYLHTGQKVIDYSRAQGKDKIVYSLLGDHRLFHSSSYDTPIQFIDAKSTYLDDILPSFNADSSPEEFTRYSRASSRYGSILYDSYRNVYYRFGFPTIPIESDEQLNALRTNPGPFVVMVFDDELNLLTESLFEAGTYLPDNSFVGEKGLYLSLNHPDNPENEEDQLKFELITLEEN
ncbi:DUF4221 family protein [Algoriphagus sp. CAU 1675]|uniref:DUF4221 family protein n=1 Tax=Algoriphagus sp. CAU 1675 TaxID=3032597 RepID=UPI0023DB933A|nr:DUF4221 family protein [Algoriphagus sp. CAU 1675]MDF2156799.1 DUF4221 family protein [Algoriphagus sp. CAU 1675]